jgi:hypothetical protein
MRTRFVAVACGVMVVASCCGFESARAGDGQGSYCLEYNEGGTDCSFTSLAQCNATADGQGAECYAVATPRAAIQEPDARAFYRPNSSLRIETVRWPPGTMAAMPMRRRHARSHGQGRER